MPVNITPLDIFPANFQIAADGDNVSQAIRSNVMQEYADAANFLKNRSASASESNLQAAISNAVVQNENTRFTLAFGLGAPDYTWLQSSITDAGGLHFMLPPLFGVEITNVVARVHGDGAGTGTHAGLPATMPDVTLFELNSDDGASGNVSSLGTQADVSANVAAYETLHDINLSGLSTAAAGDDLIHVVRVRGEAGANSLVNRLVLYRIYLTLNAV